MDQIESIPQDFRPRFGDETCFLHSQYIFITQNFDNLLHQFNFTLPGDRFTQFLFFYIPLGIIITLNIILFVLTAIRIRKVHKEAMKLRSPEDSSKLRKSLNRKRET